MTHARTWTLPASLSLAFVLALGACGGGTTKGGGGTTGSAGGTTGSAGGTTGSAGGSSGTGNPGNLACMSPTSGSTCTQAELDTFSSCIFASCQSSLATCYGSGFMSGQYSGPCGTYAACASKCACDDSACRTACAIPATCTSCLISSFGSCSASCPLPACYLGGTGLGGASGGLGGSFGGLGGSFGGLGGASGGATCADLQACCNRATGTNKTTCDQLYTSVSALGDAGCATALPSARLLCP